MPEKHRKRRILVIDADPALFELLSVWLANTAEVTSHRDDVAPAALTRADLLVVDLPFPRQSAPGKLQDLARQHPGTPVLALSSAFFGGIASHGAAARSLGVQAVLPKPVSREALIGAVHELLARTP